MVGSPLLAWYVAQAAFWLLIVFALLRRELSAQAISIFLVLWIAGFLLLAGGWPIGGRFLTGSSGLFAGYVAVLDIALVLAIFKGDVRLF